MISFDSLRRTNSCNALDPWVSVLGVIEAPSLIKISQKQYTFIMHLVDELSLFLDTLERNRIQTRSLIKKPSSNSLGKDLKMTICLTASKTFTLAVIDGLDDEQIRHPTPPPSNFPEAELEPVLRDTSEATAVIDLITTPISIVASTAKVETPPPAKTIKKLKPEENRLDVSKAPRGSPLSSSANLSDTSDETLSQFDTTEDLDSDFDASVFLNDLEHQQETITRIQLDVDSISLPGNNYILAAPLDLTNGVFVKLNQINVCFTENEEKEGQPFYVACNVKYLRLDEFSLMKFDTIKTKLFENESPGRRG